MKPVLFTGSAVALITPMHQDGSIHFSALKSLLERQITQETDAIVVCGTTGEASTLTVREHLKVIQTAVDIVSGRVPVLAGTGSNDTSHAIEMSKRAAALGADGLLLVTPYYNKTNAAGLERHFFAIADAAQIPCIVYNVPSRTGMSIHPETYAKLAQHPYIVGAKEASGNFSDIAHTAYLCGDSFTLYCGNDEQILPMMSLGAKGVISVLANIVPRQVHRLCRAFFDGNLTLSRQLQLKYLPLIQALFCDVSPMPVKAALNMMHLSAGPCRLPLGGISDKEKQRVAQALNNLSLLSA
ncbi:MAG TPA: 4-hydroxy-tetrahydrodipicolinate synthase [Candidatus Ruthenibacterium avium]|uniref:4-hydroxy-tetrahydrodipicolinate synthase n=1 Tax=Candidatus Ruthenibacterium avium TaxID=2838751 RepID=A0A9D2S1V6_9FIRM|nr:4-hydroxy-tetrahydrodipicolinate synthase [Candidatus Ruthenibacterium avium]